jgi:Aldehyde dehydrogenase family
METRLLIRGEQVAGEGEPLAVENPATEETLASVGLPSAEQLDAAVAAAEEAFPGWAGTPAVERAELLHEVAARMRARTDELARVMTLEGGKPLVENSDEVGWTAAAFDYYAEMGRNFAGRVIPPIESTQLALVVKEPIGPWACIVPWNYPLLLLAWKVAPARGTRSWRSRRSSRRSRRWCWRTASTTFPQAPSISSQAPATSALPSYRTTALRASPSRARSRPARKLRRRARRGWLE